MKNKLNLPNRNPPSAAHPTTTARPPVDEYRRAPTTAMPGVVSIVPARVPTDAEATGGRLQHLELHLERHGLEQVLELLLGHVLELDAAPPVHGGADLQAGRALDDLEALHRGFALAVVGRDDLGGCRVDAVARWREVRVSALPCEVGGRRRLERWEGDVLALHVGGI